METLTGKLVGHYTCGSLLHEGEHTVIYRAHSDDGNSVVLKIFREELADARGLAQFRREYQCMLGLHAQGAVPQLLQPSALEAFRNTLAMVLEDFAATPLDRWLAGAPLVTENALAVALDLLAGLGAVHAQGLLYLNLAPHNVLIGPSGSAKLSDFGACTDIHGALRSEASARASNLPYIAPEQTGRTNRTPDERSDFYGLGVLLFQMLGARLPFTVVDNEVGHWFHAHLAMQPLGLDTVRPDVPQALGQIVAKLLSKDPDDRYQSAQGVAADLSHCRAQLLGQRNDPLLQLGVSDIPRDLRLSSRLYGREGEFAAYHEGLQRVMQGQTGAVLFSGDSGVGKSAFIDAVREQARQQDFVFWTCKHDTAHDTIPYSALALAIEEQVEQILAGPQDMVRHWRELASRALAAEAPFLLAVAPHAHHLVGAHPPPPEVSAAETQNRIYHAIVRFLQLFAAPARPLVLCMDALQWADLATLALLERMLADQELKGILLLAFYRQSLVDAAHAVARMTQRLQGAGIAWTVCTFKPLGPDDTARYISDSLHCTPEQAQPLAELVCERTGGNPLFIGQLLRHVHEQGLLYFATDPPGWRWDLGAIAAAAPFADDVAALLVRSFTQLPQATRHLLSVAAMLGRVFSEARLAEVTAATESSIANTLLPAVMTKLIRPQAATGAYRFLHDRFQQAAVALVEAPDMLHWRIGETLLHSLTDPEHDQRIFEVVMHFNKVREPPSNAVNAARANAFAARRARFAGAHARGLDFAQQGIRLLGPDPWHDANELQFLLAAEAQINAYLAGDFEQASRHFEEISAHVSDPVCLADSCRWMVQQRTGSGDMAGALTLGRKILGDLGMTLPISDPWVAVREELDQFEAELALRPLADLLESPPVSDDRLVKCVSVMATFAPTAYFSDFPLSMWLAVRAGRILQQRGTAPGMPFLLAVMNIVYIAARDDYRSGYPLQVFAIDLARRMGDRQGLANATHLHAMMCMVWNRPLREAAALAREVYLELAEIGDQNNASSSYITQVVALLEGGGAAG